MAQNAEEMADLSQGWFGPKKLEIGILRAFQGTRLV